MVWDMKVEALGVGCLWDLIGDIDESIMMGYGDKNCGNDEKNGQIDDSVVVMFLEMMFCGLCQHWCCACLLQFWELFFFFAL